MPSGLLLPTLQSTTVQCYAGLGRILIGPCNQRERATTAGMHTDTSTDSRGANDRLAPPLVFAASRHLQHHQRGHQQSCDQVQPGFGALSLMLGRRSSQDVHAEAALTSLTSYGPTQGETPVQQAWMRRDGTVQQAAPMTCADCEAWCCNTVNIPNRSRP